MPLDDATQWKTQAEPWMVDRLRDYAPPDSLAECLADEGWARIYYLYAQANLASENVDFLWAVDEFKRSNDMAVAQRVYEQYVANNAPTQINLYSTNRDELDAMFSGENEPLGSLDMFDGAYNEVYDVVNTDSYSKFKLMASRVRQDLAAEGEPGAVDTQTPVEVGSPQQVELTRAMVDDSVVDGYNQQALKDLDEGYSTNFWQLGDLVVIAAEMETDAQPYVPWIKAQQGVVVGMITMTKKGRGLDPGSISVSRVGDRAAFEAAIARVSKKKVKYQ